jgi:hopanoid biosynthesis associated protein HpnK
VSRRLIITGDDFGLALPVNEAIEIAHRHGALTATSLLIGERAAGDAIERARRNPELRVGLHVAVCEARPVLPPSAIAGLCNGRGELRHPVIAAVLFVLRPSLRHALEAEIRAQFEAFRATGLRCDHVNGHNHMQLHPVVLPILLRVAREYGVNAIRLSYEPLGASFRAARRGLLMRVLPWIAMYPWGAYVKWRAKRAGFVVNDYLFGVYDSGAMEVDLLLGFIANLPDGVSEIHCHPASQRCPEIDRTMPSYHHEAELSALTDPRVPAAIAASGVHPVAGFAELCIEPRGDDR